MDLSNNTIKQQEKLTKLLLQYLQLYEQEHSGLPLPHDFEKQKAQVIKDIGVIRSPQIAKISNNKRLEEAFNRFNEIWAIQKLGVAPTSDFSFEIRQLKDIMKEEREHNRSLKHVEFIRYSKLDRIVRFKAMRRALKIKKYAQKTQTNDNLPSLWKLAYDSIKDNWKNSSGYKTYMGVSAGFSLVRGFTAWVTGAATNMMNMHIAHGGLGLKTGVFLFTGVSAVNNVLFDFINTQKQLLKTNILNRTLAKEIKQFRQNSSKLFLRSKSSSQITTFLTEKSAAYADLSTGVVDIARAVATAGTAMGVLITTYPELGSIGAGLGLSVGAAGGFLWKSFNSKAQPLFRKASNIKSNRIETMTNAAHDKGSVREAQVDRDMKIDAQREAELQNTTVKSSRHLAISIDAGLTLGCAAIAALCAEKIGFSGGGIGDIITFAGSLVSSSWAAFQGIQSYLNVHKSYVQYKDASRQLQVPENMQIRSGQEKIPYKDNTIEMRDVQFSYDKSQKQMDMGKQSLIFRPGKLQCVVGGSGNGKTTLVDLMTHVRDIDHGQVIINGVNVDVTNEEEIRKHVCLHDQDNNHFNKLRSVRHNLEMYIPNKEEVQKSFKDGHISQNEYLKLMDLAEHPQERIDAALERACIKDEYYADRNGTPAHEFTIDEFSPGQRQRLALACSFLEDRDIYIFDEPTSALDTPTAINVLYHLKKLSEEGKNVIVVTHSPELIALSDNVTIMEDMNITGNGAVMDLYSSNQYLQKTFRSPSEILHTRCQVYADNGEDVTAMRYELSYMQESEGKFGFIKTALASGDEQTASDRMKDFIDKIKEFSKSDAPDTSGEKTLFCYLARLIHTDKEVYDFYLKTACALEGKEDSSVEKKPNSKEQILSYKEKARQNGVHETYEADLQSSQAAHNLQILLDKTNFSHS